MKNTSDFAKVSIGTQRGFSTLLGLLLFIVLAGGGLYLYSEKVSKEIPEINPISTTTQKKDVLTTPTKETPIACTMDARQCPDGTYVGRTGPNCEFVCPNNTIDTLSVSISNSNNPFKDIKSTQNDFVLYLAEKGDIKVDVDKLQKVYLNMPHNETTQPDTWKTFYDLVQPQNNNGLMPLPFKLKGNWLDEKTFQVLEISWIIG